MPQKLVAKHIINWLPSTLHTSSTTGKIRFIRTFLFGHLCFDVAQTKERSHVATKSRLRAIQPNHLCHRSLAFLHDNVITFNVFKIAYAFPSSPWNFPSAPFVATPVQICSKHGFYRKNTKRIATKTANVLPQKLQIKHSENYKWITTKT